MMKICQYALLTLSIVALCQQSLQADNQPPSPPLMHSATHATKIGAALDQPGIPITIIQNQAGSIPGKRTQIVRGIYPVTKDFSLYINGLSVRSSDPNGLTAKGLEIKIAFTIKGGSFKNVMVESRFIDNDDIPKLQQFLTTMEADAKSKTHDEKDHTESTYITPGSTTFGFARNGKEDTDYYVLDAPNTVYDFHFKSGNDIAKMQEYVNDAATWIQAP